MITSLVTGFFATSIGKKLPPWVWEFIAVVLLVVGGVLLHHVQVVRHDSGVRAEQKAADDARWNAALKTLNDQAFALRQQAEHSDSQISNRLRSANEQENRNIAGRAGAELVRGPGKADARFICDPRPSAASGGSLAPDRSGDATVDRLPAEGGTELIALPFAGAVAFARQHDEYRSEVLTWRQAYAAWVLEWSNLKTKVAKR